MRFSMPITVLSIGGMLISAVCYGWVSIGFGVPDSWPAELQTFNDRTKVRGVSHGIQETDYEILFYSAEEFEKAWPHILSLKSKGAPLILDKGPSYYAVSGSTLKTGVRILCPPADEITGRDKAGTARYVFNLPWKDPKPGETIESPEYIKMDGGNWVSTKDGKPLTHGVRARVDIVLVADGKIIDLNRIKLPENTTIIDRRFN
ncbi:MAG: hypothetical protein IT366_03995 [Candidatus Hydrogenedentes bacterium]|nr:hypothetical protein [Candidatus Hydrogenedentota bacterium]